MKNYSDVWPLPGRWTAAAYLAVVNCSGLKLIYVVVDSMDLPRYCGKVSEGPFRSLIFKSCCSEQWKTGQFGFRNKEKDKAPDLSCCLMILLYKSFLAQLQMPHCCLILINHISQFRVFHNLPNAKNCNRTNCSEKPKKLGWPAWPYYKSRLNHKKSSWKERQIPGNKLTIYNKLNNEPY